MDHFKRPSIAGLAKKHGSNETKKHESKEHVVPVKLNMVMESPPALFLGSQQTSSGALISGRLQITPAASEVTINSMIMYLECTVSTKRPVAERCRECASQVNDLFDWTFFSKPTTFKTLGGTQDLPFSHLIPGHLPATTVGQIGSVEYSLHVRAKCHNGEEVELRRPLKIQRALRPGNDKSSVRIFPPTNLALNVTLPSIMHPIGDFNVNCRMTGITSKREDTQTRWRLRKLTWRIEEHETMVSPACTKHAAKVGGDGKGVQHESMKEIGSEELKRGWKTDFEEGQIEGEFVAHVDPSTNPQTGVESPNGLKITHCLVVELVIAEEWASNKKPISATPTGAARVLRTQFNLNLTDRAGMGLAWDDETPPMYEDVPASPPRYFNPEITSIRDYDGDDLHEDVERLHLEP